MVPFAQLFDGDAKAIGNGYECIGAAQFITLAWSEAAACGDRNDEFVAGLNWLGRGDVIVGGDFGGADVERGGNLIECLAFLHHVETPAISVLQRNVLEALEENVMRAGRNMEDVGDVARCGEAKECGVERDDFGSG